MDFPKKLYVTIEGKEEGEYINASGTLDEAEHEQLVAVYERVDVLKKRVKHSLEQV